MNSNKYQQNIYFTKDFILFSFNDTALERTRRQERRRTDEEWMVPLHPFVPKMMDPKCNINTRNFIIHPWKICLISIIWNLGDKENIELPTIFICWRQGREAKTSSISNASSPLSTFNVSSSITVCVRHILKNLGNLRTWFSMITLRPIAEMYPSTFFVDVLKGAGHDSRLKRW